MLISGNHGGALRSRSSAARGHKVKTYPFSFISFIYPLIMYYLIGLLSRHFK